MTQLDAKQLAVACAQMADAKKADDIRVIEVGDRLRVADYFVVCTGTSRAHVKGLFNELHVRLKAAGHPHQPAEGTELGWWVEIDFSDVIVHLLQPEAREYYGRDEAPVELPERSISA
ncbi:MAG: ribosome silencing factor [Planctomycetota bacterium]